MERQLLPLIKAPDNSSHKIKNLEFPARRSRINIRIACNFCRSKKVACDGHKPTCKRCLRSDLACVYAPKKTDQNYQALQSENEELKRKNGDWIRLMSLLKSAADYRQNEVLQCFKLSPEPSEVLHFIRGLDSIRPLLMQEMDLDRGSTMQSRMEIELTVRHPFAYPSIEAIDLTATETDLMSRLGLDFGAADPLTLSPLSPFTDLSEATTVVGTAFDEASVPSRLVEKLCAPQSTRRSTSNKSLYSEAVTDDELQELKLDQWSRVAIDPMLAASAISMYLKTEHPLFGFLDPKFFLSDLQAGRLRFCSSLLVNALLCRACQMYVAFDSRANRLAFAFRKEAERIRLAEKSDGKPDSLTTAVALQILSLVCVNQGKNDLGSELLDEGAHMGERLGFFGASASSSTLESFGTLSDDEWKAVAHSAWGMFTWIMVHALFHHLPGLAKPPKFPIPSQTTDQFHPNAHEQKFSTLSSPLADVNHTFEATCKFAVIIHEMTSSYYRQTEIALLNRVTLAGAESLYQKLLAWGDVLSPALTRLDHCHDHVVIFHIWYHIIILDILRPFMAKGARLLTFSAPDSSPEAACRASLRQLKNILQSQALGHQSRLYNPGWQAAYLYVANAVLNDTIQASRRFYFLLCIDGYLDLAHSYSVAKIASRGLLFMAMSKNLLSGSECNTILHQFQALPDHHDPSERVRPAFIVDLDHSLSDPGAATVSHLADKFEELVSFTTYTNGDDFDATNMART